MHVTINGEVHAVTAQTMQQLLDSLGIDPRKIAVEHNAEILPKAAYATTAVAAGDLIEIVHFVGGG